MFISASNFNFFFPVRHLFEEFDGDNNGPEGPGGPIGTTIKAINSDLKPFIDFARIQHNLPDNIDASLFKDKADLFLLFKLTQGVASG